MLKDRRKPETDIPRDPITGEEFPIDTEEGWLATAKWVEDNWGPGLRSTERECIDCREAFEPRHGYEKRCFKCWREHADKVWREERCPSRRCKECRQEFFPETGYERYCSPCRRDWGYKRWLEEKRRRNAEISELQRRREW